MALESLQNFFGDNTGNSSKRDTKPYMDEYKPTLTASMTREQESRERYHEIGENIKKSEQLRGQIIKDIKNKVSSEVLLLTALECITLMTGDTAFLKQNKSELQKNKLNNKETIKHV